MAYGVKYRVEFVDFYSRAIKVDISQEDWAGAITSITPAYPCLSIEWPADRANIFDPVRGAMATLNVYASSVNQFSEFFDAYETEYKMEIYISAALYWTGFVMVGEHQEAFNSAPYVVSLRAYDLGYLQQLTYDRNLEDDDRIIDVIIECLSHTNYGIDIKERVNIYEDSINSTQSDSMLNQINLHQPAYFDDDWVGDTYYDVLAKLLTTFNAFIMQENGVWNICRVEDMVGAHNYRVMDITTGGVNSSGSEDNTKTLASYNIINNSGIMMAASSWKNLMFFQDYGVKNLVHNGHATNEGVAYTDIWTRVGNSTISYSSNAGWYGGSNGSVLKMTYVSGGLTSLTHDKTYTVESSNSLYLEIKWRFKLDWIGGTGTSSIQISVEHDDGAGSVTYVNLSDGTWGVLAGRILTGLDKFTWYEGSIITDKFPANGTLSFVLLEATYATGATSKVTMYDYIDIRPIKDLYNDSKDYSEEINANNLTDEEVIIYHGDSEYTQTGAELHLGSFEITSSGLATGAWQTNTGSRLDKVAQLCADCYKAQYTTTAQRLQATIKGQLNYLDIMEHGGKSYIPSSMTYHVDDSEWQGERIELKTLWGADIMGTMTNSVGRPYDIFGTSQGYVTATKSQTLAEASVQLGSTAATAGVLYKINLTVSSSTGVMPELIFAGTTTAIALGVNVLYVKATSTASTHATFFTNQGTGDVAAFTITGITIKEAIGI